MAWTGSAKLTFSMVFLNSVLIRPTNLPGHPFFLHCRLGVGGSPRSEDVTCIGAIKLELDSSVYDTYLQHALKPHVSLWFGLDLQN